MKNLQLLQMKQLIDGLVQGMEARKPGENPPVFVKVNGGKAQPVTQIQLSGPVPQIPGAENLPYEVVLVAGTDEGLRD
jgi:hypothetical protein